MNKADLINKVAEKSGLTKTKTAEVIDTLVGTMQEALSTGEKITLVGFGSFDVSKRDARKGRNPKTGEEIAIAAKSVVRFKSGKELTESVNS
jgi:DNA-binding protein HU-beta